MQGQYSQFHHGCGNQSSGLEVFYGYCHETNRMRMMNYPDYVNNVQTGYSNLYNSPASAVQPMMTALSSMMGAANPTPTPTSTQRPPHKHGCGCGCQDCGCRERDCSCSCCIRCADVVEYARCGEARKIPVTFDNDTRRERDVTLQLGNFATESGLDLGWQASLSESQFKLPPCGEKTVLVTVNVDCSKWGVPTGANDGPRITGVDSCKVAYATLRAEGCMICPLVLAVAVLPDQCSSHRAGCGCGCSH